MNTEPNTEFLTLLNEISSSATRDLPNSVSVGAFPSNPFVGLRPFERDEDLLFFGRREQTIELLQKLKENRFLAIVGTSGCGKSSLIQAGLISKLRAGFLVETRDQWRIANMHPGDSPLRNVASAVLSACGAVTSEENVTGLVNAVHCQGAAAILDQVWPLFTRLDVNLLLLVDQFEEIFRFGEYARTDELDDAETGVVQKREEASEFVALMLELADQRQVPIHVVMAMRSDFLGDCDNFFGLPQAMNRSQYLVPRLTRQQRQEAIERPVLLLGETIAPRLLDRVLNDIGEESDQLPIMQHALMRTWDQWTKSEDGEVDLRHYEAVGTITDALSQDAERALEETGDVELTRKIFQLLTDKDEHGRRVRRPANVSEIEEITGASHEKVMGIIDCFRGSGRSFLTVSEGRVRGDMRVDISHESLIRQWKTLRDWVDEEAESRAMYLRISEAAARHLAKREGVWRNPALQLALDWRKQNSEAWAGRYNQQYSQAMAFVDKSRRRRRVTVFLYCLVFGLGLLMLSGMAWYRQRGLVAEAAIRTQQYNNLELLRQRQLELANSQREQELRALDQMRQQQLLNLQQQQTIQRAQLAEAGRKEAEAQRAEAERQKKIAELKSEEALSQTNLANARLAKYQAQLKATQEAKDEALRQNAEAERQRLVAEERTAEAKRQADEAEKQRLIAVDALNQRDAEQKEREKAQQEVARLEKERRESAERREDYRQGKEVSFRHPLLGDVPYHQGKNKALEINQEWVNQNIVTTEIPELRGIPNRAGRPSDQVRFHKCGMGQLQAALKEIREKGLLSRINVWERTFITAAEDASAQLRDTPTSHFLGIAFDINSKSNPVLTGNVQLNTGPGSVVELAPIFEKHGFSWGGNRPKPRVREPAHFELIRIDPSDQCSAPPGVGTYRDVDPFDLTNKTLKARFLGEQLAVTRPMFAPPIDWRRLLGSAVQSSR